MASILGIGNALTDILAVLPDDKFLKEFHLPKGSMQHVDMETGDKIWKILKPMGVQLVAGGSAANAITGTAIFGMESGFIGKVGDDDLGHLFKSDQEQYGIKSMLLKGVNSSGRAMVFITAPNAERTFAVYLGAALELVPEDLKPEYFEGYDYFHIEGYLVQNQSTIRRAVELGADESKVEGLFFQRALPQKAYRAVFFMQDAVAFAQFQLSGGGNAEVLHVGAFVFAERHFSRLGDVQTAEFF